MDFDYGTEKPIILIMDGGVSDEIVAADIICTIDIGIDKILSWLERHKPSSDIIYKGDKYKGVANSLNLLIFKERCLC